jgi:hypothetical protein
LVTGVQAVVEASARHLAHAFAGSGVPDSWTLEPMEHAAAHTPPKHIFPSAHGLPLATAAQAEVLWAGSQYSHGSVGFATLACSSCLPM